MKVRLSSKYGNWPDKVVEMTESEVIALLQSGDTYSVTNGNSDVDLVISVSDTYEGV